MLKRPGWKTALLVGLVVGLAAGGTVLWAAIPNNVTGAITACYPTSGTNKGALRVINYQAGERCATGEAMLNLPTRTFCSGYPHPGVDLSIPGSTPGHGCNLSGASLIGFPLDGAKLANANLASTNLKNALLRSANLSGANFTGGVIAFGKLQSANLRGATLTNVNAGDTNFSGADLSGATGLSSAQLGGAVWSNTTCPDGTNSDNDGNTCAGHG